MALHETQETDYVAEDRVRDEMASARKLFLMKGWPMIDVSRRAIEETAAAGDRLAQPAAQRAASLWRAIMISELSVPLILASSSASRVFDPQGGGSRLHRGQPPARLDETALIESPACFRRPARADRRRARRGQDAEGRRLRSARGHRHRRRPAARLRGPHPRKPAGRRRGRTPLAFLSGKRHELIGRRRRGGARRAHRLASSKPRG